MRSAVVVRFSLAAFRMQLSQHGTLSSAKTVSEERIKWKQLLGTGSRSRVAKVRIGDVESTPRSVDVLPQRLIDLLAVLKWLLHERIVFVLVFLVFLFTCALVLVILVLNLLALWLDFLKG